MISPKSIAMLAYANTECLVISVKGSGLAKLQN